MLINVRHFTSIISPVVLDSFETNGICISIYIQHCISRFTHKTEKRGHLIKWQGFQEPVKKKQSLKMQARMVQLALLSSLIRWKRGSNLKPHLRIFYILIVFSYTIINWIVKFIKMELTKAWESYFKKINTKIIQQKRIEYYLLLGSEKNSQPVTKIICYAQNFNLEYNFLY